MTYDETKIFVKVNLTKNVVKYTCIYQFYDISGGMK